MRLELLLGRIHRERFGPERCTAARPAWRNVSAVRARNGKGEIFSSAITTGAKVSIDSYSVV